MNSLSPWGIKSVNIKHNLYPEILKKIPNPPKILYFRGKLLKNETCFAIVGTRRCSDYGKEVAFSFARHLARAELTIVSGMARGIDTFAHKGALEVGARTIAVLGTGLDEKSIYPQENLKLAKKILENGGCLISEYPPETPGSQFTFPRRNRIISGMSLGVLVVEAKLKSGALITADWARKQKRKVFAIPGSLHSLNSKGPHLLIKKGIAKLVDNPDDILKELNRPCLTSGVKQLKGGSEEENLILEVLKEGNLSIDKIIEKTKLPPQKVSSVLSLMEIENKVKNLGGNIYALSR
jgi:DNA processing protein